MIYTPTSNTDAHILQDSVRGVNSYLISSSTNGAGTFPVGGQYGLTSFNYNGWTHASYGAVANSAQVAWSWKAGGAPTADNTQTSGAMTANSVSLDGVLQSAYTPSGSPSTYPKRMSIGTKQGFSIVLFGS